MAEEHKSASASGVHPPHATDGTSAPHPASGPHPTSGTSTFHLGAPHAKGRLQLSNPLLLFSSMPARYRIFILTLFLSILALLASLSLFGFNNQVFSSIALFFLNVVAIMLMAGLIYVLCFWTAMRVLHTWMDYLHYILLAVLAYFGGALIIGFFLYLSLTALTGPSALSGQISGPGLLIFISLSMAVVLTFLARIFSAMEWKRAEDLVFSIAIYSVVVGTLFFDAQSQSNILLQVGSVYSQAFGWVYIYIFLIAVVFELLMRKLYLRWHAQEQNKISA